MYAVNSTGSALGTPENAPLLIGLALVALATLALWYRRDVYWVYRSIVRYPEHGLVSGILQVVVPILVMVAGIALIVLRFVG